MRLIKGDAPSLVDLLPTMRNPSQVYYGFSSIGAVADHLESRRHRDWWRLDERDKEDHHFYGCTYATALHMARDGWSEGADRVAALRDKITATRPTSRRLAQYAVAGALPNVPRYVAGNPKHMLRPDNAQARNRPVLTLVNHMGGLAGVDRDCFVNKCAVVAALVDVIEDAGFSCNVIGVSQSQANGHLVGVAVNVKEAGQHVDLPALAFGLGHVGMFRRLVFCTRTSDRDNQVMRRELPDAIADIMVTLEAELTAPEGVTVIVLC